MQGRRYVLAQYPTGMPGNEDLRLETSELPAPGESEIALRTIYLSLDPYMRGRMSPAKSYAAPLKIGEVITAEAVSEVTESNHPDFTPGDIVLARTGWQTHAVIAGDDARKIDPAVAPVSTALGVLGMPGFTAYVGLKVHGQPKQGETVVVSAAAGAVGQIVGQLARHWGCRAVGIAGGPDKCALVTDTFGFDACIDYKADGFAERLAQACPDGIDIYFENVGGEVLKAVLPLMNQFGRIPVCGTIAYYNLDKLQADGPDFSPLIMRSILTRKLRVHGFINYDHIEFMPDFLAEVPPLVTDGSLKYVEDIVDGFDNTVEAFQGLLTGRYTGKVLVKVGDDPTR
ncbi:MAG: NADP-dependent oxidoreductase [Pseudomonadota bacterium]|nr:NADP-dependent oxidoreductase [Pseudomonadota bacterium]